MYSMRVRTLHFVQTTTTNVSVSLPLKTPKKWTLQKRKEQFLQFDQRAVQRCKRRGTTASTRHHKEPSYKLDRWLVDLTKQDSKAFRLVWVFGWKHYNESLDSTHCSSLSLFDYVSQYGTVWFPSSSWRRRRRRRSSSSSRRHKKRWWRRTTTKTCRRNLFLFGVGSYRRTIPTSPRICLSQNSNHWMDNETTSYPTNDPFLMVWNFNR